MSGERVLVIGSGLAGLGAAWRLSQRGFEVSILEREEVPGGRVGTDTQEGFVIDACAGTLSTSDSCVKTILSDLELEYDWHPLYSASVLQASSAGLVEIDPTQPRGIVKIPGVRLIDGLRSYRFPRLARRYAPEIDPCQPEKAAALDFRSLSDFATLYFGRTGLDAWVGPWLRSATPCDERDTSRVLFLLHAAKKGKASPVVLRSGLGALVRAVTERIDTRVGVEALSLTCADSGEIEVQVAHSGVRAMEKAAAVVLATSPQAALRVSGEALSWAEQNFLANSSFDPAIVFLLGIDADRFDKPCQIQMPRSMGSPIESIFVEPGRISGRAPDGTTLVRVVTSAAWAGEHVDASDEVIEKELRLSLLRLDARFDAPVLLAKVLRLPRAFARFDVGRYRALAQFQKIQADHRTRGRRLYFAGDYLQGPSPEAALCSGFRAAESVARDS